VTPPPGRSPAARRTRGVVIAVATVAVLAAAGGAWLHRDADPRAVVGGAEWIWRPAPADQVTPIAFFVACDLDLTTVPAAAELLALGDERYVLWINGRRVGSDAYSPGAPLDVYSVASLLRPGRNRLAAELRSGRGAGGFLASLRDPATGHQFAVTGAGWRRVDEQTAGFVEGDLPLAVAKPVVSWGRPPVGRWGVPVAGPHRPLYGDAVDPGHPLRPVRFAVLGEPLTWRSPRELRGRLRRSDPEALRPGLLFDWGREVEGYLGLRSAWHTQRPAALLFTGDAPRDPLARLRPAEGPAEETDAGAILAAGSPVVSVDGRRNWSDVVPRRFRYAAVVGFRGLQAAWVEPVISEAAAEALPRSPVAAATGVFGVTPPPSRSPVEDDVWRELQRLADLAGREGG
jgi:hypothetical protein